MIDRYHVPVMKVDLVRSPTSAKDYVALGDDLLTPKEVGAIFEALIFQRETSERQEVCLGSLEGIALVREGVASIQELKINSMHTNEQGGAEPGPTINSYFLERIPLWDVSLAIAAKCSLTRWQDAHYVIEPMSHYAKMTGLAFAEIVMRGMDARRKGEPLPVRNPPKPVLIDDDGVPWYRVQVTTEPARVLSRQKRTRVTPDFLRDVWRVYGAAQDLGEPTTQAVRDWSEQRTGRVPSNPTIFRWIKSARELYGAEEVNAQNK